MFWPMPKTPRDCTKQPTRTHKGIRTLASSQQTQTYFVSVSLSPTPHPPILTLPTRTPSDLHLAYHLHYNFPPRLCIAEPASFSFTETWQKRRSSFEFWVFENVNPSGIGCTSTWRFTFIVPFPGTRLFNVSSLVLSCTIFKIVLNYFVVIIVMCCTASEWNEDDPN